MRTISIVNQKGGCGKTTTAINLSSVLARRGLRTLLVDLDPQSHCAAGLGVPETRIERSVGEAMLESHDGPIARNGLFWEVARDLDLIPSTMSLSALEAPGGGLHDRPDRDRRLASLLGRCADRYDFCIIDCPPTIGLLTFNALRAADEAIIPVETGYFSMRGAEKQWTTIERLIGRLGRPMPCHILPTLYDERSRLAREILSSLRRKFTDRVLPLIVREHAVLREAASFGQPVTEYAPDSDAAGDFQSLAEWLLEEDVPHAGEAIAAAVRARHREAPSSGREEAAMPAVTVPGTEGRPEGSALDRASEVAVRVRELADRADQLGAEVERTVDEALATPPTEDATVAAAAPVAVLAEPAADAVPAERIRHLCGVRMTGQGVLFAQPISTGRTLGIAGEFNGWNPTRLPLQANPEAGVHQAVVHVPPGTYEYRVVVDGRWQPDPYNPQRRRNAFGDENSVLTVVARSA